MVDATTTVSETDVDYVVEIEQLAALDPVLYDMKRLAAAKRLGIRPQTLDAAVKRTRKRLGLDKYDEAGDDGQGRAVNIPDAIPWHEPVDGDMLAITIACAVKNHLVLDDTQADPRRCRA
jgi:hypothetical protein